MRFSCGCLSRYCFPILNLESIEFDLLKSNLINIDQIEIEKNRPQLTQSDRSQFWKKVCCSMYTLVWPLLLITLHSSTIAASCMLMLFVSHQCPLERSDVKQKNIKFVGILRKSRCRNSHYNTKIAVLILNFLLFSLFSPFSLSFLRLSKLFLFSAIVQCLMILLAGFRRFFSRLNMYILSCMV